MNQDAKRHLEKARDYVGRGDGFYRKAAEEIIAAQKADHTLSNREIGEWFGRGADWVRILVQWSTNDDPDSTPFGGELVQERREKSVMKKVLTSSEPEQIAELLEDPEVRQNLAAAQRVHEFRQENQTGIPRRNTPQGPSFISIVLRVNGWLDELVGMVERGEAEVPVEFSTQSLTDIGVKAMRLKELVDDVRAGEEVNVA